MKKETLFEDPRDAEDAIQIIRIGQLVILCVPGEFTTMVGRRLRDAVKNVLTSGSNGKFNNNIHVLLAGLTNTYSQYVTTFEEYQIQRYEVRTVFIDGLSPSWDEDRVEKYLKKYGAIEKIELARNMPAARRKDFGFVTFDTHNNAVVCADGITNCEIGEGDNKAKVRARLSRPIQRPPRMKHGLRGNFRIGHSAPRGGHFPYAHCPPPRRPPPRIVRPDVSRLPPIRSRPLKRPIDIRDRRPVMSIPDRVRRMLPLERSYDRRPPAPVYPKRSPRREYGRHDELPPPRSRAFNLHAVFKEVHNVTLQLSNIRNVMSFIKPIAAIKKLSVAATLSPDLPLSAIGDEKRLMQTILNICGNAVKFTKEGHISLLASIVKSDSLRDFRTADSSGMAQPWRFWFIWPVSS